MSYILDALRRADSERERGAVPGLHAQSMRAEPSDLLARPWWGQPWAWVGAGVCGGLLVAVFVRWLWADPVPTPLMARTDAAAVAPPMTPRGPPPAAPGPGELPTEVPGTAPVVLAAPAPAPPVAAPPAVPAPPIYNAPPIDTRRPAPPGSPAGNGAARAPAGGAGAAEGTKVLSLQELPDDVRSQLPNLSIGGSSYSEHAPSRLLILNGQIFREGDRINADVSLEQIQLKSAVLRFKTYRYRLNY